MEKYVNRRNYKSIIKSQKETKMKKKLLSLLLSSVDKKKLAKYFAEPPKLLTFAPLYKSTGCPFLGYMVCSF